MWSGIEIIERSERTFCRHRESVAVLLSSRPRAWCLGFVRMYCSELVLEAEGCHLTVIYRWCCCELAGCTVMRDLRSCT